MRALTFFCFFFILPNATAQTLKGKLFGINNGDKEILPGGLVRWISTNSAVCVNENGVFELPLNGITDRRIVASMTGYVTDTFEVGDKSYLSLSILKTATSLKEVTITDRSGAYISTTSVGKMEIINQQELTKAACCDLAGCFGTQATVQPQTTNVVTNAQELRILGLSGVYNQVLLDGMPMIQGLSYTYGIGTYPGTIVANIFVAKGTTSVLQGFESISGQINLESRQPDNTDKLYLNAYANSFGEKHFNANLATPVGKKGKLHSLLALHMVQPARKTDGNDDGFLDLPLLTRYVAYNKWKYGNDKQRGLSLQAGLRGLKEERIGGQTGYNAPSDEGSTKVYGQSVRYLQGEGYVKSSFRFSDIHSVVLSVSGFVHNQTSWFGPTSYKGQQQNGYFNLQHEWKWKKAHVLKYGASYRYQNLSETIRFSDTTLKKTYAGNYLTTLSVPGVFAENAFHWASDKVVALVGLRLDQHQRWGLYFTPRSMLKYTINGHHTFRASVGKGWRQVNLFSEQINLLISSRDILFAEELRPESAVNWGISHTYRFTMGNVSGTLSGDFYSTDFKNQFFPDYDTDPLKVIIKNFIGLSHSNGAQVEASLIFFKQIDVRVAYNYTEVYRKVNDSRVILPFNPNNRMMGAFSFHTKNNAWQADANVHWFDKMKLPDTRTNPTAYVRPLFSSPYYTLNLQATFRWKNLSIYTGCENIFNYRQPNPIISADDPFGPYFDISSVWGPTRGREFYLGVRYSLK